MAFRSHELNLVLRMQDRASSRLRRVANDIGGVNRAAQLQRNAARTALSQERNLNQQAKIRQQLEARTSAMGERNLARQAQMLRLKANEATLWERLGRAKSGSVREYSLIKRIEAGELDMLRLRSMETAEVAALNGELVKATALQAKLAQEAEATALALARAQKAEARQRLGTNIRHIGGAAAVVGGAGLLVAGGAAGAYADFNRQATRAATQLRGPGEGLGLAVQRGKQLEATITGLSRTFPATMTEMANSAYEIASGMNLGTTSAERLANTTKLLTVANKAAVAGGIDLASATDSMIVTMNNFDPRLKDIKGTMNTLFATVKYGKGTFDEFSPVFGKMSAGAKTANQNLKSAGGAVAFLSTRMASQGQAVTGYVRLLQIMQRKEFVAGFKAMFGVSELIPGTDKLRPLQQIIAMMVKARPTLVSGGGGLANIIAEITARGQSVLGSKSKNPVGLQSTQMARTAIQQLIMGWKDYAVILKEVTQNKDEFDKSYSQMSQSPGVRWQVAKNQFKAFAIIIGQNVLPSMLRLMSFLQGLVHRFEALSPGIKKVIGMFTVFGSLTLFVGGGLAILAGSIISIADKFKDLNKRLFATKTNLAILGAIGAISIIFHSYITGTADAKSLLAGAVSGALLGARFGPAGAAIGAITVPIVMQAAADKKGKNWKEWAAGSFLTRMHDRFSGGPDWGSPNNKKKFAAANAIHDETKYGLSRITNEHKTATANILQDWQNLTADLTGLQYMSGLTQNTLQGVTNLQLALSKAQSTGNETATVGAAKNLIKFYNVQEAKLEKLKKLTPYQQKQLNQYYTQEAQMLGLTDKATAATTRQQKAQERAATALDNAKQKVDSLKLSFQSLREQELSKLEGIYGSMFQGPINQGPLGQIYSNINNTLQGFGAKPISVPLSLTLQDQASQQRTFDMFTKDLSKLSVKVPKEFRNQFTEQVMGMGSSAVPFLEGVLKGNKGQQAQFIKNFVNGQKSIKGALKSPWETQLRSANIQFKAANMQLAAAKGRVAKTTEKAKAVNSVKPTRTTQSAGGSHTIIYHGDTITVRSDETNAHAIKRYFKERAFNAKHRGK